MLPDQVHPFRSCPHSHLSESPAVTGVLPNKNKPIFLGSSRAMVPCSMQESVLPQPWVIPLELHEPCPWRKWSIWQKPWPKFKERTVRINRMGKVFGKNREIKGLMGFLDARMGKDLVSSPKQYDVLSERKRCTLWKVSMWSFQMCSQGSKRDSDL